MTSIFARPTSSVSSRTRSFASSRPAIEQVDDETFEIAGDLTMNGVTKPITLTAEVQGEETDPWGNERVALEVTGQLNRGDWDMTFNQALGSGNLLVGEKVKLAARHRGDQAGLTAKAAGRLARCGACSRT